MRARRAPSHALANAQPSPPCAPISARPHPLERANTPAALPESPTSTGATTAATTPQRTASFYSLRPSTSSNDAHRSTRGHIWWCRPGFQLVTNTSVFYLKNHTTTSSMIHHPSRVSGRGQKTRSVRRWRPNTGAFRPALAINARRRVFLNPPHQRSPPPFLCLGSLTSTSGVL